MKLVETALAASRSDGCVVVLEDTSTVNLRWAKNAMTTNADASDRTLTVISVRDGGVGIGTRSVATCEEAVALVRASERLCAPVEDTIELVAPHAVSDAWDAELPRTGPAELQPVVEALDVRFELYGYAEHKWTSTFLATSTGLRRRFDQHDARIELTGRSRDRSAWFGAHTLDDPAGAVARLERDLTRDVPELQLPPGRYETLLPPAAVADLMVFAYTRASARDADEGRSVFAGLDRVSQRPLTLYSDPAEPGLECAPFAVVTAGEAVFDNGMPLSRTAWIEDGRLNDLVRTRAWARRTGRPPRGAIGNLILDGGGSASLEQMIATTERGLLLTSLWYVRELEQQTLTLTGLTRDGVYLIERGEVVAEVNNFRFNESPIDLLRRVTEVGRTERALPRERAEAFPRTAMSPLRIADFNCASTSSAR